MRNSLLLSLFATILIGCSGGDPQAKRSAVDVAERKTSLTGKWKGQLKMSEPSIDDPAAQMGKAMAEIVASGIDLEFPDETHFKLTVMTIPIEGDVQRNGNDLTLIRRKILGTTPEKAAQMSSSVTTEGFDIPIKGSITADGTSITLRGTKETEPDMEFVRDTEASIGDTAKVGSPTVSSLESEVVGKYVADVDTIDQSKLSPEEKEKLPLVREMMKSITVELHADNTFKMKMVYDMEGDWKMDGTKIRLNPRSAMGIEDSSGAKQDPIYLNFRDGQLWNLSSKNGEQTFAYKKL